MAFKNFLLKAALAGFGPSPHPPTGQKRILCVATTALGDTLWATPALVSLRKSFPNCFLGVLTSPIGMQILKHNPHVDKLFLAKEPFLPKFFSLRSMLQAEKFDTVLFFHASQRLALPLAASIGASRIVGTEKINKGLDSLLTDPLPNIRQHEILRRLKMVEEIGGRVHSETLSLFLQEDEHLPKREGRWVALHPGSKDRFKRWPKENFAAVGCALKKRLGMEILITGSSEEEELMREVAAMIPGSHLSLSNLSFRSFAALLEQMDLLISNDTGPFHVACALKTPAIGLYASTDPFLCGPHHAKKAIAIAKKSACTPCLKRKCRLPFCLLQIGPCEVIEAAIKILT
jgi:ADP-heptose:LPS heptosyltransferase